MIQINLDTTNFRKYMKTIETLTHQGSGMGRAIYLNFKDSTAYVNNVANMSQAKIRFSYSVISGEGIPRDILVDAATFKNYYQSTDIMLVGISNKTLEITYDSPSGKVSGSMPFMIDDDGFPRDVFNYDFKDLFTLDTSFVEKILLAQPWIVVDEKYPAREALFISKRTLFNADPVGLYLVPVEVDVATRLSKTLVPQIISFGNNCVLSETEQQMRLISEDGCAVYIEPKLLNYEIPDQPVSEQFSKLHSGSDSFVISLNALNVALSFIEPFTASSTHKLLQMSLENNKLIVNTENIDTGSSTKELSVVHANEATTTVSKLNLTMLKKALKTIKKDFVEITPNGDTVFFKLRGATPESKRAGKEGFEVTEDFIVLAKWRTK